MESGIYCFNLCAWDQTSDGHYTTGGPVAVQPLSIIQTLPYNGEEYALSFGPGNDLQISCQGAMDMFPFNWPQLGWAAYGSGGFPVSVIGTVPYLGPIADLDDIDFNQQDASIEWEMDPKTAGLPEAQPNFTVAKNTRPRWARSIGPVDPSPVIECPSIGYGIGPFMAMSEEPGGDPIGVATIVVVKLNVYAMTPFIFTENEGDELVYMALRAEVVPELHYSLSSTIPPTDFVDNYAFFEGASLQTVATKAVTRFDPSLYVGAGTLKVRDEILGEEWGEVPLGTFPTLTPFTANLTLECIQHYTPPP